MFCCFQLISESDLAVLRNLNYTGFTVESDVGLQIKEDDSYHPSNLTLFNLASKETGLCKNPTKYLCVEYEEYDFYQ